MAPTTTTLASLQVATLDNTVGALFCGVLVAMFLFGLTTLQTSMYYHLYPNDSQLHKYSVALLWILDALHLVLTTHAVYAYVVTGFGNTANLELVLWSIKLQVAFNIIIILIVHSLYALRVWILGEYHRGLVGYLVGSALAGGFVIGIVLAYEVYTVHTYGELAKISWVINSAIAANTAIDFVITASMCYYLWKSRAPVPRLNSRISTAVQYTLGSGLFTSSCSLSMLFTYNLLPNTFIFLALEFLVTKLYVLSFLTMLNARKRITTADNEGSTNTPVTDLVPRRYPRKFLSSTTSSQTARQRHSNCPASPTSPGYGQKLLPFDDAEKGNVSMGGETLRGPPSTASQASLENSSLPPLSPLAHTKNTLPSPDSCRPLSSSYPWHAR